MVAVEAVEDESCRRLQIYGRAAVTHRGTREDFLIRHRVNYLTNLRTR